MSVKHQEGTATIERGFLVITFEGWTAPAAKKQSSPLRIDLSTVVAVEQRLKGADRTIRIVTDGYVPAAKLTDDPHVLRFIPVRESTKAEVDRLVDEIVTTADTHRGAVGANGMPDTCLHEVEDLSRSPGAHHRPHSPRTAAAPSTPSTPTGTQQPESAPEEPVWRWQGPQTWPPPPPGWSPPAGWESDPSWPPAPAGWQFWTRPDGAGDQTTFPDADAEQPTVGRRAATPPAAEEPAAPSSYQGRRVAPPAEETAPTPAAPEPRVAGDADPEDEGLAAATAPVAKSIPATAAPAGPTRTTPPSLPPPPLPPVDVEVGLFGARGKAKELGRQVQELHAQNAQLRHDLERLGALDVVELENRRRDLAETIAAEQAHAAEADRNARATAKETAEAEQRALAEVRAETATVRAALVVTRDDVVLQEVGVYDYTHPLDDSVAYKAELERLKDRIKTMNRKDGGAVLATTGFTMNGSVTQGRKMVREFSKLLQRAYNNEADNLVRSMRPYKLDSARDRLSKSRQTIERLGQSMDIHISAEYHRLRLTELELTADHINKLAEEKEREREERARLREERKAQAELDRERERLAKEQQHYLNALAKLEAAGNTDGLQDLRDRLAQIGQAIEDVDFRAANVRAGYVYVISNLGSFGERMVKVGMTRRLEPMDRVRELSDASVPFNFDVHAIHFSNDAVGVEAELHRRLAAQRVNRVNHRREFFYATPAEVRDLLAQVTGNLLEYTDTPEAAEFHQSINSRTA